MQSKDEKEESVRQCEYNSDFFFSLSFFEIHFTSYIQKHKQCAIPWSCFSLYATLGIAFKCELAQARIHMEWLWVEKFVFQTVTQTYEKKEKEEGFPSRVYTV